MINFFLADFFRDIPKAPGHYCRKDSKVYLSIIIQTMSKLHKLHKARCHAFSKQPFSIYTFTQYFKDHNFSLFQRKKDLCNTCVGYDEGNVTSTEYDAHQKRKNDGLNLDEQDKINSDNHKIITVTADTESLLLSPLNDANNVF